MAESSPPVDPATAVSGREGETSDLLLERLAHDLRGPLSPLQTAAYLLRRPEIEPDQREELLSIIDRQTARLSTMVQEVSDWMRVRQSRLVLHRAPVAPALVVELSSVSSGVDVQSQLEAGLDDLAVDGDVQRLVQMLSTLMAFMQARTCDGPVTVRAKAGAANVFFEIASPGTHWASGEREALFAAAETVPFDEGLGMRLLIARAIAAAHGGNIIASADADGSALIRVDVPCMAVEVER